MRLAAARNDYSAFGQLPLSAPRGQDAIVKRERVIVVADQTGRLCNRLFQFAHLIAFAAEHGLHVANPGFHEYANDFPSFADDALCRWPRPRLPLPAGWSDEAIKRTVALRKFAEARGKPLGPVALLQGEVDLGEEWVARLARKRRLLLASGPLLRCWETLSRQRPLLREIFMPAADHVAAGTDAWSKAGAGPVVGLHIRRGDYARWNEGYYFWPAGIYAEIVDRLSALPSRPAVLACSDDPAVLDELGDRIVRGPGEPLADLWALSLCDVIVGPPSTFSGWAAFQGGVPMKHLEEPDAPLAELESTLSMPRRAVATGHYTFSLPGPAEAARPTVPTDDGADRAEQVP